MHSYPKVITFFFGLIGALMGVALIGLLAGHNRSLSTHWFSAVGLAVIAAALVGYGLTHTERPAPRAHKFGYSLLCGGVSALSSLLNFVVASRIWRQGRTDGPDLGFFHDLTHPWLLHVLRETGRNGTSWGLGWIEMVVMGLVCGGIGFIVGFRVFEEP